MDINRAKEIIEALAEVLIRQQERFYLTTMCAIKVKFYVLFTRF